MSNQQSLGKVYCALLAGGTGKRMKSANIPKQFLDLNGKPVIIRTIENVQKFSFIDEVIIAMHRDWHEYFAELLQTYQNDIDIDSLVIVDGGDERIDSIQNSVDCIKDPQSNDIIIIHDAVRPFIEENVMKDCVDKALIYGASLATIPAQDTMLYSQNGELVEDIPVRAHLFNGQSPDAIRLVDFINALNSLTDEQRKSNFGTVQISRLGGLKVYMVESSALNMKITTDSDLEIARMLLSGK